MNFFTEDLKLHIVLNNKDCHPWGSSFDNISFDKNAQKMNVLNRWKYFYFEKNYVEKILNNDEIKKLNYEIFNILMPKIY